MFLCNICIFNCWNLNNNLTGNEERNAKSVAFQSKVQ